jgi:hypothetical protein
VCKTFVADDDRYVHDSALDGEHYVCLPHCQHPAPLFSFAFTHFSALFFPFVHMVRMSALQATDESCNFRFVNSSLLLSSLSFSVR